MSFSLEPLNHELTTLSQSGVDRLREVAYSAATVIRKDVDDAKQNWDNYIPPLKIEESALLLADHLPKNSKDVYQEALPGYKFDFPKDAAAHKNYKSEWWYYNGHLKDESGHEYGYELTFFRHKIRSQDFYAAHMAVTDVDGHKFYYDQKSNIVHPYTAGASSETYKVRNDGWTARAEGDRQALKAAMPNISIELNLDQGGPPVVNGVDGISQKASGPGEATHYYSFPRMSTTGTIIDHGKEHQVVGTSWMDHEFGSNILGPEEVGWNWYCVQLNNNMELMLMMVRQKDGSFDPNTSGTLIMPDGTSRHLKNTDFSVTPQGSWKSPTDGATYPMGWKIEVPSEKISLTVKPLKKNQELNTERSTTISYWEGDCSIAGSAGSDPVKGEGYVEMTGYLEPLTSLPGALKL